MTKVEIKFRPIERETLELLRASHEGEGGTIASYGRLMSAAMVAGAILGLTKQQIAQQAEVVAEQAIRVVENRADIFGARDDG